MKTIEIENNDLGMLDDSSDDVREKKNIGRRRDDLFISNNPGLKLNFDRRASNSDRRKDTDHNYRGPARRNTIDRRLNNKDRREQD